MRGDFGLPGYQVEGLLGAGPTGEVWLATEQASGHQVALKRLRLDPTDGPDAIRRLLATLASIGHDHLLPVRRLAEVAGEPVLICEYAASGSLGQLLTARARLDPGEAVTTIGPVAEALAAVHARELVHGDITPENILFTTEGRPLLADTGLLALVPASGEAATGTHGYTDPRVIAGAAPSKPADVYGLAAAAWAALTGTSPEPTGRPSLLSQNPGVPPGLAHAIESGLQAEPAVRPGAAQFAEMIYASAQPAAVRFPVGLVISDPSTGEAAGAAEGTDAGRTPAPARAEARMAGHPGHADAADHAGAADHVSEAGHVDEADADWGDRPARLGTRWLPLLLGAAGLVLAAALVVAGVAVFGNRGMTPVADPSPSPHTSSSVPTPVFTAPDSGAAKFGKWGAVVDRLLAARARALFDANASELTAAFMPNSTIRADDADQIATWLRGGKRVSGFTTKVTALKLRSATASTVKLTATTHVQPYTVVDADGTVLRRFPASQPATGTMVLKKNAAGHWRIYSW